MTAVSRRVRSVRRRCKKRRLRRRIRQQTSVRRQVAAAAEAESKHTASAAGKDLELEEQIYFEESKETEPENNPIKSFQVRRQGSYRKQLAEKEEQQKTPIYSSTLVLAAVICVLGFVAYQNHQKMNENGKCAGADERNPYCAKHGTGTGCGIGCCKG